MSAKTAAMMGGGVDDRSGGAGARVEEEEGKYSSGDDGDSTGVARTYRVAEKYDRREFTSTTG